MKDKHLSLFVVQKSGHSYVYVVWPDYEGDSIDGICDAIASHGIDPGVPMTLDESWTYMNELREKADEEHTGRSDL